MRCNVSTRQRSSPYLLLGPQSRLQLLYRLVQFCLLGFDHRRLAAHTLQLRHLEHKNNKKSSQQTKINVLIMSQSIFFELVPVCVAAQLLPGRLPAVVSTVWRWPWTPAAPPSAWRCSPSEPPARPPSAYWCWMNWDEREKTVSRAATSHSLNYSVICPLLQQLFGREYVRKWWKMSEKGEKCPLILLF